MFCGLDGEINVYINVIYFDVNNFVSVVGVLFVAHLEGVSCDFVSGTSGVKWELTRHILALLAFSFPYVVSIWIIFDHIYNDIYDRKKRKKEKVF